MTRELQKVYGDESETPATRFLEQNGFVILERNFFAKKLGEIDIIAKREDALHFIEVKSGKSDSFDPVTCKIEKSDKLSVLLYENKAFGYDFQYRCFDHSR